MSQVLDRGLPRGQMIILLLSFIVLGVVAFSPGLAWGQDVASLVSGVRGDGTVEAANPGGVLFVGQQVNIQRQGPKPPGDVAPWWLIAWGEVSNVQSNTVYIQVKGAAEGYGPERGDTAVFKAGQAPAAQPAPVAQHSPAHSYQQDHSHQGAGDSFSWTDRGAPVPLVADDPIASPYPMHDNTRGPHQGRTGTYPGDQGVAIPNLGHQLTLSFGLQGSYVHAFQTGPEGAPSDDQAGKEGPGGGGGLVLEARIHQYLGIATGLLFEQNTRKKTNTFLGDHGVSVNYYPKIIVNNLRLPLMVKASIPLHSEGREAGRIWFGIGPEIVTPMAARTEIDYEISAPSNIVITNEDQIDAQARSMAERYGVKEESAIHLTGGFGFAVKAGDTAIGLGIRASWNAGQENKHVSAVVGGTELSAHTLDVRATLSIVYDIPIK